jgi:hypothetical protein
MQCKELPIINLKHERLAKYLEIKYGVNLKRFCYHLVKSNKSDFLLNYLNNPESPHIQKEILKANKIIGCNMDNVLQNLCSKIESTEYVSFIENLSSLYQNEKIMFIKPMH